MPREVLDLQVGKVRVRGEVSTVDVEGHAALTPEWGQVMGRVREAVQNALQAAQEAPGAPTPVEGGHIRWPDGLDGLRLGGVTQEQLDLATKVLLGR